MAYPNYQQFYPQYYQQGQQLSNQVANTQHPQSNLIWVQGEAGAKSYLVAPNTTVQLWDSESKTIYLKSADASGMPSMRVLDYTFRDAPNEAQNESLMNKADYVTREEFNTFKDEIKGIIKPKKEVNADDE